MAGTDSAKGDTEPHLLALEGSLLRANYDAIMLVMNGIESDSRVIRTARSVLAADLSVVVIGLGGRAEDGNDEPRRVQIAGLDAWVIPAAPLPSARPGTVEQGTRHRALLDHYVTRVVEICGDMAPRVIHTHDMTTIAAGARLKRHFAAAGRPVSWIHDLHEWVGGLSTIAAAVREVAAQDEENSIRFADRLTTVSPAIATVIAAEYGLEREPTVILNAPLLAEFDPDTEPTIRTAIGLSDEVPLAVYSGQVKEARGVHDLVDSLALVPELHLGIVSNNRGHYIDELKLRAKRAQTDGRLHFVPYVDQRDVASFLRTADVGVHPLARYGNGDVALPNKLFEYLHAGLPIVVSDCKAMAAFVSETGTGRVYEAGDVHGLARALRQALDDSELLRSRVASIRSAYTWEDQERTIHAIYAELLGVGAIATKPPYPWHEASETQQTANQIRVLHGVAGSAGQPWALAEGLRRRGHVAHNIATALPRLGFRASLLVPWRRMDARERFAFLRGVANDFEIFHFHARSLFFERGSFRFPTLIDLLLLRMLGKVVVFHFRGSEARLASVFEAHNPFNYVRDDPYGLAGSFPEDRQRKMIEYVTSVSDAVYVTDPELQAYVPGSEIVARAIDLKEWQPVGTTPISARPLVIHAPTRTALKGTDHLLTAVDALRREGLDFDFVQVADVPQVEARKLYEQADVIVDQLLIGWYGVLAVEGMALAKPVVSYVRPGLIQHLGPEMPLAIADPTTIRDVLRTLVTDADARARLGAAGREYVERVHSADVIAAELEARYRNLLRPTSRRDVDYEGVAALIEMQAEYADASGRAVTRALKAISLAEAAQESAESGQDAAANLAAQRQIASARHALEQVAQGPMAIAASSTAEEGQGDADQMERVVGSDPTQRVASDPPVDEGGPPVDEGGPPVDEGGPPVDEGGPPVIPALSDVRESNRWGTASLLERLAGAANSSSWEEVASAAVEQPELGLKLLARLADGPGGGHDRDSLAVHLARCTARAFQRLENRLLVKPRGDEADARSCDPKIQVRFARQYHNLRSLLGPDAEMIAAALLRSTLDGGESGDGGNPFRDARDEKSRTRLNDLCWYFVNTAAVSRALDGVTRAQYERSLAWFADRLGLWEVPAFRTTRTTLDVRVPIRIMPKSETPSATARLQVSLAGDPSDDAVRIFDRRSGRIRWIERTIAARLDRSVGWDIELRGPRDTVVSIDMPSYAFDPRRSTPRVADWRPLVTIELKRPVTVRHLEIDAELLGQGPGLIPFEVVGDRYKSRTLERQIEQLNTLERLHPGYGFGERAARWQDFVEYWAGQPISN